MSSLKRLMCAAVVFLVVLGFTRAANYRFRDQEAAFRQACRDQLQKLGLTRAAAKAKYPTPEIRMVSAACVPPGGTGEVIVRGKFVPGSKFIFQNDSFEVVKENLTPAEYRATLKAASGSGPQDASLTVISPVTGISAQHGNAAKIAGKFEWNMQAANGWKVVARPNAAQPCGGESAGQAYDVAFYRSGENAPFEKLQGTLHFDQWSKTNYRLTISPAQPQEMNEYTTLMQKMSDPNLTSQQREQLIQKVQQAAERMQANMKRMMDPAYVKQQQEKRQQFGCEWIEMEYPGGGSFTGRMRCAEKVGQRINLAGTLTGVK